MGWLVWLWRIRCKETCMYMMWWRRGWKLIFYIADFWKLAACHPRPMNLLSCFVLCLLYFLFQSIFNILDVGFCPLNFIEYHHPEYSYDILILKDKICSNRFKRLFTRSNNKSVSCWIFLMNIFRCYSISTKHPHWSLVTHLTQGKV